MTPDYAEILRLYRKFSARPDEPLWVTFVLLGQEMERVKPERCKACFRTHLEYSRLVDATCADPFHAAPSLEQDQIDGMTIDEIADASEDAAWSDWFGRAQPFDGVEEAFRAGFRAASAALPR